MYTLSFNPTDRKYERIYGALVSGDPPKDRGERKAHGCALDKLEAIGQVIPALDAQTGKTREFVRGELRFYETISGGDVHLENAEFDVVKDRTLVACKGAHPSLTRETEHLETWLELIGKDPLSSAAAPIVPAAGE